MKTDTKKKEFDCVKMKNDIQAKIYKKIKKMNVDEIVAFFNSPKNRVVFGNA
ncbi:MAG: hypothetical protein LBE36_11495 [Flavobacteriaceae bacterium]|jgi:hypothetical protein|nr:hypothetical protein [Flavobacteriaceae bacterium]